MRFKLKPQTCMLVAGLVTSAYATTCYYQQTSATCFTSGAQVDTIYFPSQGGFPNGTPVLATSDWIVYANNVVTTPNGNQGHTTYNPPPNNPPYCQGPAKFTEPVSGHLTTTPWQNNAADVDNRSHPVPVNPPYWGTTSGATCP